LQGDGALGTRDLAFHARLMELALQAGNFFWRITFSRIFAGIARDNRLRFVFKFGLALV
jgi:hypothetical protein